METEGGCGGGRGSGSMEKEQRRAAIEWSAVVAGVTLGMTLIVGLLGQRIGDTHRRIDDTNLRIEQTNQLIEANGRRIDETNRRIDETNRLIQENAQRIDERFDALHALIIDVMRDGRDPAHAAP